MRNYLGEIIYDQREMSGMTQDQFGSKYNVSGPAIFKFEKGYVKPSLELWMKMSKDFEVPERRAVLLWLKAKLPEEYQDVIDLKTMAIGEAAGAKKKGGKGGVMDYAQLSDRVELQSAAKKDTSLPRYLRELLIDDELWGLFKPTGKEINFLRDTFGNLGKGSKSGYRDALRLVREFNGGAA